MQLAVPHEIAAGEQRVAVVPSMVPALQEYGWTVTMQQGAGCRATFVDDDYTGVTFYAEAESLYQAADVVVKVAPLMEEEIALLKPGTIVVGMLSPTRYPERIAAMEEKGIIAFSLEQIPRISRAQAMDVLSSQATAVGYKAVLLAATLSQRFFPMLTTAAGTIRPASVLVIGAGVAGLQAIATARRLGAVVKAYDVRAAAREQIESLGATMVRIDVAGESEGGYARELTEKEKAMQAMALLEAVRTADVVICTAQIPGREAPKIITTQMVESMQMGSVIVDIAAASGGNCELTQPGKTLEHRGVSIVGAAHLASAMARDASSMYAKNVVNFLGLFKVERNNIVIDWNDPIIAESVVAGKKVKEKIS